MVGERDGNAIVVNNLFVDADFQIGEGEARWCVMILSIIGSSESENVSIRIFPISYHPL